MKSEALEATEAYSVARSTHPRVSFQDMKDKIVHEVYFTASEAMTAPDVHQRYDALYVHDFDLLTICLLHMKNGFVLIGESAPASPENFDPEKGRTFAFEDAIKQLWPLEGYALRERLCS